MRTTTDQADTWTVDYGGLRWIQLPSGKWTAVVRGGDDDDKGDPPPKGEKDDKEGDDTDTDKSGGTDTDKSGEEKTLSQKEVNAIVTREVSKASRGKVDPKELGFDSAKDLKEAVEAGKTKLEESKTEQQRQIEEAVKQATEKTRTEVMSDANKIILRAEFIVKAKDKRVQHLGDAYVIAQQLDSWDNVKVDDRGKVTGLDDDFFEELKKEKAYLFEEESEGDEEGEDRDIGAGAGGSGKRGSKGDQKLIESYPALAANAAASGTPKK